MIICFTKQISSSSLVMCCLGLDFFVLQTCCDTMPSQKEEISRSVSSTSTTVLDSLAVEVSELRPSSSNFVRIALVVF